MLYTPTGPPSDNKPSNNKLAWLNLIIRCIILSVLVYGIFLEAGICTALFALFVLIGTEIRGHVIRRLVNEVMVLHMVLSGALTGRAPYDPDGDMVD